MGEIGPKLANSHFKFIKPRRILLTHTHTREPQPARGQQAVAQGTGQTSTTRRSEHNVVAAGTPTQKKFCCGGDVSA